MMQSVTPISKASLKRQCLIIADGDLERAKELYDFWVDGMSEDLPTFDPKQPSWVDNFGNRVNSVLDWAQQHKDILSQGVDLISNLVGKRGVSVADAAESLEEIN